MKKNRALCALQIRLSDHFLLTFRADAAESNFAVGNHKSSRRTAWTRRCVQIGIHAVFCLTTNRTNQMVVRLRVAVVSSGRTWMQHSLYKSFVRQRFKRSINSRAGNRRDRLSHLIVNNVNSWMRSKCHQSLIYLLSLNGYG